MSPRSPLVDTFLGAPTTTVITDSSPSSTQQKATTQEKKQPRKKRVDPSRSPSDDSMPPTHTTHHRWYSTSQPPPCQLCEACSMNGRAPVTLCAAATGDYISSMLPQHPSGHGRAKLLSTGGRRPQLLIAPPASSCARRVFRIALTVEAITTAR
jgi:hypothetical protein